MPTGLYDALAILRGGLRCPEKIHLNWIFLLAFNG